MNLGFKRELTICPLNGDGPTKKGILEIKRIELNNRFESVCYSCYWSLEHVHPEEGRIHGEDPMSALLRCMEFLKSLFQGFREDGLDIYWEKPGDLGGLKYHFESHSLAQGTNPSASLEP